MGNDITKVLSHVRWAKGIAKASGRTLAQVFDSINNAIKANAFQVDARGTITGGQVVSSTAEAGGSVAFAFPAGTTPDELVSVNEESIAYCNGFSDPENPNLTLRRIKRMRASFWRARPQ